MEILLVLNKDLKIALKNILDKIEKGDKIQLDTHLFSEKYLKKVPLNPDIFVSEQSFAIRLFIILTAILTNIIRYCIFGKKSTINIKKLYNRRWYRLIWTKK